MIRLDFSKLNGLIPTIIQDHRTNKVLMLGFMNEKSWEKTIETGRAWFYSRSRRKLWMKGEESGNVQKVKEILIDCDNDSILLKVEQIGGAACHTGYISCFYRQIINGKIITIEKEKIFNPKKVYKEKK